MTKESSFIFILSLFYIEIKHTFRTFLGSQFPEARAIRIAVKEGAVFFLFLFSS